MKHLFIILYLLVILAGCQGKLFDNKEDGFHGEIRLGEEKTDHIHINW